MGKGAHWAPDPTGPGGSEVGGTALQIRAGKQGPGGGHSKERGPDAPAHFHSSFNLSIKVLLQQQGCLTYAGQPSALAAKCPGKEKRAVKQGFGPKSSGGGMF